VRKRVSFQGRSDGIVAHPEVISLWQKAGLWKVFIGFEKIEDGELLVLGKRNRTGYPRMRLGWDGLAVWVRKLDILPHFFKVMRSARNMGNEDFFLSGQGG